MKTDNELLDELKKQFDYEMDYQIGDLLGMSPAQISQVRSKTNPRALTTKQRIIAYDHLGYAWAREAMLDLFPEQISLKLRAMDISKTKRLASKNTEEQQSLSTLAGNAET